VIGLPSRRAWALANDSARTRQSCGRARSERRRRCGRDLADLLQDRGEPLASGEGLDDAFLGAGRLSPQVRILGREPLLERANGREQARVLDRDGRLAGEETHPLQVLCAERATGERRQHALKLVPERQRPSGERHEPVVSRPGVIGDALVVRHVVGAKRLPRLGDVADLARTDGDGGVEAVEALG
jgi:hypothetical protein